MPHSHLLLPPIPSLSDMATSFRWIRDNPRGRIPSVDSGLSRVGKRINEAVV